MKKQKKIKFKRYLAVFKRNIKTINRKKISRWLGKNFKRHPFILGLLIVIWANEILLRATSLKWGIWDLLKFHFFVFAAWLILVVLSNSLKDKQKVKWYFKKRFVFFMLIFFTPLGLVFLWAGARFKKITKIALSVIFGLVFLGASVYNNIRYEKLINKTSLETTIDMITKQKKKTFINQADAKLLENLKLSVIPQKSRVKLAASDIASRCLSGVVSIKIKDKNEKEIGQGSGFIVSQDGFIVTNYHVVATAHKAEIKIGEDDFKDVSLVKVASDLDIAILKINAQDLPALPIGNSDGLVNGQFVMTLGNPWGFERSVSSGIVSALRSKGGMKLIQMTAPVSPGSSGGPVINEYGEVVGITTIASLFWAQNLNFAIPINYLHNILKEK